LNNRWFEVYAIQGTINTSDRRDKENIAPLEYGLKEVLQLNPVSFNWKGKEEYGRKIGLIAQELKPIIGEVVKDWHYERTDEDGGKERVESPRMGVYYSDLIPVLIKSIQEQQKMIDELKKQVEALSGSGSQSGSPSSR